MKIILIGPERSGKTTLFKKLTDQPLLTESYKQSVGVSNSTITFTMPDTTDSIPIELWDTPGSSAYQSTIEKLIDDSYEKNDVILVSHDLTRRDAIEERFLASSILSKISSSIIKPRIILVGTKADGNRAVSDEQLKDLSTANGYDAAFTSTSEHLITNIFTLKPSLSTRIGLHGVERARNPHAYYYGIFSWIFGGLPRESKCNSALALYLAETTKTRLKLAGTESSPEIAALKAALKLDDIKPSTPESLTAALHQGELGKLYQEFEETREAAEKARGRLDLR